MELVISLVGNNDPIILRDSEITDRKTVQDIYELYEDGQEKRLTINVDKSLWCFNSKNISLMILNED